MKPKKILISTSTFGVFDRKPLLQLKKAGYDVLLNPHGRRLSKAELLPLLRDAVGLIAGTERLDDDIFRQSPHLRVISRCGSGMDTVDMQAAHRRGIVVRSTPEAPVESVAELALALMLATLRRTHEADRLIRHKQWKPLMGRLLEGKTVGLIGLGRIGKRVVELLQPFHVRILARDKKPDRAFAKRRHVQITSLDSLLRRSDIVSLHVGLDASTRGLIGASQLRAMKPSAILINTSRGELVDDRALAKALQAKKIAGAGLDVYPDEPYHGPLLKCDQAALTAHMGSYAFETRLHMEHLAVHNLLAALRG